MMGIRKAARCLVIITTMLSFAGNSGCEYSMPSCIMPSCNTWPIDQAHPTLRACCCGRASNGFPALVKACVTAKGFRSLVEKCIVPQRACHCILLSCRQPSLTSMTASYFTSSSPPPSILFLGHSFGQSLSRGSHNFSRPHQAKESHRRLLETSCCQSERVTRIRNRRSLGINRLILKQWV